MSRRICSVWSWPERLYLYYAAPPLDTDEPPNQTKPRARGIRPPLGDPPEQLLRVLPPGSLYVGRGLTAQGEIVTFPSREHP